MTEPAGRHLPRQVAIETYGGGGFRFDGIAHRGSLLCLPSGLWAWPVVRADAIDEAALAPVLAEKDGIGFLLIGAGRESWIMPDGLRLALHRAGLNVEVARTGSAVSTYNILFEEGRRVAAALLAVD